MGAAAARNSCRIGRFILINCPPSTGPPMAPKRPMASAQPTPLERNCVGYSRPAAALLPRYAPRTHDPAIIASGANRPYDTPLAPMAAMAGAAQANSAATTTKPNRSSSVLISSPPTVPPMWYRLDTRAAFSGVRPAVLNRVGIQEF